MKTNVGAGNSCVLARHHPRRRSQNVFRSAGDVTCTLLAEGNTLVVSYYCLTCPHCATPLAHTNICTLQISISPVKEIGSACGDSDKILRQVIFWLISFNIYRMRRIQRVGAFLREFAHSRLDIAVLCRTKLTLKCFLCSIKVSTA